MNDTPKTIKATKGKGKEKTPAKRLQKTPQPKVSELPQSSSKGTTKKKNVSIRNEKTEKNIKKDKTSIGNEKKVKNTKKDKTTKKKKNDEEGSLPAVNVDDHKLTVYDVCYQDIIRENLPPLMENSRDLNETMITKLTAEMTDVISPSQNPLACVVKAEYEEEFLKRINDPEHKKKRQKELKLKDVKAIFYLLNGQHRLEVVKRRLGEYATWPAVVYSSKNINPGILGVLKVNGITSETPNSLFEKLKVLRTIDPWSNRECDRICNNNSQKFTNRTFYNQVVNFPGSALKDSHRGAETERKIIIEKKETYIGYDLTTHKGYLSTIVKYTMDTNTVEFMQIRDIWWDFMKKYNTYLNDNILNYYALISTVVSFNVWKDMLSIIKEIVAETERYEQFPNVKSFLKHIPRFFQKLHLVYYGSPDVEQAKFTDQNAIYFTLSFDEFYRKINEKEELYSDVEYVMGIIPDKKTQWKLIVTDASFIRHRKELIEKMEGRQITHQVLEEEGKQIVYSRFDGHVMPIIHWTVDIFQMVERLKHQDETGLPRSIIEADFVHLDIPYFLFPDAKYDTPEFVTYEDDYEYAEAIAEVFFTLSKKESIGWIWCSDLQYSRLYDAIKEYNEPNCKVYHIYMHRTNARGEHIHGLSASNAKVKNVMENAMLILRGRHTINNFKSEDFLYNLHPIDVTRNLGWNRFEKPETFMESMMKKLHITVDKKVVDGFSGSNSVLKGAITNLCKSLVCIEKDPSQTEYFQKRQQRLNKKDPRFSFSKTESVSTQILTPKEFKKQKQKTQVIESTESESEVEENYFDLEAIEDNQENSPPGSEEGSGEELDESEHEDDEEEDEDSNDEEMKGFIVSSSEEDNNESEVDENDNEDGINEVEEMDQNADEENEPQDFDQNENEQDEKEIEENEREDDQNEQSDKESITIMESEEKSKREKPRILIIEESEEESTQEESTVMLKEQEEIIITQKGAILEPTPSRVKRTSPIKSVSPTENIKKRRSTIATKSPKLSKKQKLNSPAICCSSCMGAQCTNPVANKGDICDSCSKFQCDFPGCDSMCAEESNFCSKHS
ncbi:hypothetical protein BC833DRAFT_625410 [Globomyces pollinis-pini]|nr:hypothetical protein BC833DRAFT_625410 [Globomyces pollinis-pini]